MNLEILNIKKISKAGACAVSIPRKDQVCEEYNKDAHEDEIEEYDPEIDSPSSWTTKSSHAQNKYFYAIMAQVVSNIVLLALTLAGVAIGVMEFTGTDKNKDHESVGGLIIFGAIVGGAVSLILVNVSWLYRGSHYFNLQLPGSPDVKVACPTAQVASSCIVLTACVILVPTYREDADGILVIIFGIVLPLLIMVNLPLIIPVDEDSVDGEEQYLDAEAY